MTLRELLTGVTDAIAPARCLHCMRDGFWLCDACYSLLLRISPHESCIGCGKQRAGGRTCNACLSTSPFTGAQSLGPYHAEWLRRGVQWLKFRGVQAVASELARLLVPRLLPIAPVPQLSEEACLIPVPLHSSRLHERGFNQSEVVAQELSRLTAIPVASALQRIKSTSPQSELPEDTREANVANSFEATNEILTVRDKRLAIVIDDVLTSGATLTSAGRVLREAAPDVQLWALTAARR